MLPWRSRHSVSGIAGSSTTAILRHSRHSGRPRGPPPRQLRRAASVRATAAAVQAQGPAAARRAPARWRRLRSASAGSLRPHPSHSRSSTTSSSSNACHSSSSYASRTSNGNVMMYSNCAELRYQKAAFPSSRQCWFFKPALPPETAACLFCLDFSDNQPGQRELVDGWGGD